MKLQPVRRSGRAGPIRSRRRTTCGPPSTRSGPRCSRGGSLREALRNLLRRGPDGRRGLDDLLARARRNRREAMRRGQLDGAVTRAQQLLDQAIAAERDALAARDDADARFAESMLDNLPRSTARAVRGAGRRTSGPATRRAQLYQRILDGLRQEIVEQRFRGLTQALADPAGPAGRRPR